MKRIQLENRTDLKSEIPLEAPYSIFIDPSSVCNFKCNFCMNSKIKNPGIMSFDLYKKIIDDLQEFENPIKVIRLYGFGEPLLNSHFCDMVSYAKQSNKVLAVDTTTNASLLTMGLNLKLIKSEIDRINISIEGLSSEAYKNFAGRILDFDRLVDQIAHLYSIKNKTTIFIKINGDYLHEDGKQLFYDTFRPISDGCDIEHTAQCWYDSPVENVNKELGVYGQPRESVEVCPYLFYSFMINYNGEVSACFLDWDQRMIVGDVKRYKVKQIWNDLPMHMMRMGMLTGIRSKICQECDQLCAGMPVDLDPYKQELLRRITKL